MLRLVLTESIPVSLDAGEILQGLQSRTHRMNDELSPLMEEARSLIEPRAVYSFLPVTNIRDEQVRLEGNYSLKSVVLSDMLELCQEIAPYVITVGPRLEERAHADKNLLRSYLLEKIADHALGKAEVYLKSHTGKRLGAIISAFSPGSGTGELFGIDQQEVLFRVLDPAKNVGVHLSSSFMMIPRKSVSGIFAATRKEYISCAHCPKDCESRKTPYVGKYQRSKKTQ